MASIKNRKSKGKAILFDPLGREYNAEYALRKQQFADLPPAKLVRPLRAVRGAYKHALKAWDRAVGYGGTALYPYFAEARYRTALIAAAAGKGHLVRRLAA